MSELVITEQNYREFIGDGDSVKWDGQKRMLSAKPRFTPFGCYRNIKSIKPESLIPRSEWDAAIALKDSESSWLSDFIKPEERDFISEKEDQDGLGYCFPAGTLIRMADGSEKPIQELKVLDEVVTAEGNIKHITQVISHWHKDGLMTLNICGHKTLRATPNHPILTKRGYVQLQDIKAGDFVALPRYTNQCNLWINTSQFIVERFLVKQTKKIFAASVLNRKAGYWEQIEVPDIIHLTPGFGRLVGLFLAEGHTSNGKVCWSYGKHERDTFAQETVDLLKQEFGATASVQLRAHNVAQVVLHGSRWAKLFEGLFLSGAQNKRLPPELSSGPIEFLKEVLQGWLDGDRQRGTAACSISHSLAMNMFDIANMLGFVPRIEIRPEHVDKKGLKHKKAWVIHWQENFSDKDIVNYRYKTHITDKYVWRKVDDIPVTFEPFENWVFNLEVEDDHSYIAEGIGVHNCWVYCVTICSMINRIKMGLPLVALSAESVGGPINNWRNEGGWPETALQRYISDGACEQSFMNSPNSLSPRKWKTGWESNALNYRVTEWMDLDFPEKQFEALVSAAMWGIPCACVYDWWGHAITGALKVRKVNGKYQVLFWNSWGLSYGENGWFWMEEGKGTPSGGLFGVSHMIPTNGVLK